MFLSSNDHRRRTNQSSYRGYPSSGQLADEITRWQASTREPATDTLPQDSNQVQNTNSLVSFLYCCVACCHNEDRASFRNLKIAPWTWRCTAFMEGKRTEMKQKSILWKNMRSLCFFQFSSFCACVAEREWILQSPSCPLLPLSFSVFWLYASSSPVFEIHNGERSGN